MQNLTLRPATAADRDFLYRLRVDPLTRQASLSGGDIALGDHERWLEESLRNPKRRLLIAEVDGVAVGTLRVDDVEEGQELSWTVAPEARGRGIATAMVTGASKQLRTRLVARIKSGNAASVAVAQSAGFSLESETDGVLCFIRPASG